MNITVVFTIISSLVALAAFIWNIINEILGRKEKVALNNRFADILNKIVDLLDAVGKNKEKENSLNNEIDDGIQKKLEEHSKKIKLLEDGWVILHNLSNNENELIN